MLPGEQFKGLHTYSAVQSRSSMYFLVNTFYAFNDAFRIRAVNPTRWTVFPRKVTINDYRVCHRRHKYKVMCPSLDPADPLHVGGAYIPGNDTDLSILTLTKTKIMVLLFVTMRYGQQPCYSTRNSIWKVSLIIKIWNLWK